MQTLPLPAAAFRPVPRRASSGGRGPWLGWLRRVLARQSENSQLRAMDLRDLRDAGLTPGEARDLAAKPLWRA